MWTRSTIALLIVVLAGCESLSNRLFGEAGERMAAIGYTVEDRHDDLYAVHGIGNDVWAVGAWGTILYSSDAGESWQPQRSTTTEPLCDVRFAVRNQGWAVGKSGLILQTITAGDQWQQQQSFSERDLLAVWPIDTQRVWVVGDLGVRLYTENGGGRWVDRSLGQDTILNDIVFIDDQHGAIAGEFRTVLLTDDGGKSWRSLDAVAEVSDEMNFFAVSFVDRDRGYLSGIGGTLVRTADGGATWSRIPYPSPSEPLFNLAFTGNGTLIVVGGYGTVTRVHTGGAEPVRPMEIPEANGYIRGVHFNDATVGWAVGERGLILKTTDGGQAWRSVH